MEQMENVVYIPVFESTCGRSRLVGWVVEFVSTMVRPSVPVRQDVFDEADALFCLPTR